MSEIMNKLQKYSKKPIKMNCGLESKQITVRDIVENSMEWYGELVAFAKYPKNFFIFDINTKENVGEVRANYEAFVTFEKTLTDSLVESLDSEQIDFLYDLKTQAILANALTVTQEEFDSMSILEVYIRDYIREKFATDKRNILDKTIKSLKYLLAVDSDFIIDEKNMKLSFVKDDKTIEIDGDIFDEICSTVRYFNCENMYEIDDSQTVKKKYPNEEIRKRMEKILAERKKIDELKKKDESKYYSAFETILSYVLHSESGDYDKVLDYTIFQLHQRYNVLSYQEIYKNNLDGRFHVTEEGFKKLDLVHWNEKMRKEGL